MRTKSSTKENSDEQILAAAEAILLKRLERQGKVSEPSEAGRYLRARIGHSEREVFGYLFLDTRHQILGCEHLFFGTIDGAEVQPREVVKRGLLLNAAAVIAFHNHPSGNLEPSAADRAVTARLKQALALVDIRLLDHLVVSAEGFTSMASRGWV
ncbi:JAB domain-containing protein [Luteimonas sp. SMYT11W]|uniref:JAB domain-containing protein n=1 Tax=Luteimonas flava TaxID=3115822 RepID=A0ABU7WFI0_9GAMM